MKKAYIIPSSLVIIAAIITVSTASAFASGNRYGQSSRAARAGTASNQIAQTSAPLSTQDQQNLLYMIEEEKLAHDLYIAFYVKWGLSVFKNISTSETNHQKAVSNVLAKYGISDPRSSEQGVFTNPDLQALYNTLLAQGLTSSNNAIAIGIAVEKKDVADLQTAIESSPNSTIDTVYDRLKRGSENHLRAFSRLM
jgi:hypothetical protein